MGRYAGAIGASVTASARVVGWASMPIYMSTMHWYQAVSWTSDQIVGGEYVKYVDMHAYQCMGSGPRLLDTLQILVLTSL